MSFLREVQLEKEFGPSVVFREALGFLPNLIRAQSLLPRVIEAQAKLEDAVRLRAGALSCAKRTNPTDHCSRSKRHILRCHAQ